ncbi:hypothetical protein ACFPLB_09960 [Aquamicrobium segne]|uniref:Uncharacterized protein n=1 Tax=Aquamicrobium segne TaxID=469547 RepID=A0ABW0GX92_9HYPH
MTRKGEIAARQKLATTIQKQIRSPATHGLLLSMPSFKVTKEIPQHLQKLLDRLEKREMQ